MLPIRSRHTRYDQDPGIPVVDPVHLLNRTHASTFAGLYLPNAFTRWLMAGHGVVCVLFLVVYALQVGLPKGGTRHRWVGRVAVWCTAATILTGGALLLKQDWFDDPHPESLQTFPTPWEATHGHYYVSSFLCGFTLLACHAFYVPFAGRARCPLWLWALHAGALWVYARAGLFYYAAVSAPQRTVFDHDVLVERCLSFWAFPVYDLTNLLVLRRWVCGGGRLNWRSHHTMNSVWCTSIGLGATLFFVAHDARYLFPYPGLGFTPRLVLQVLPQLGLYVWYGRRIARYVLLGPTATKLT